MASRHTLMQHHGRSGDMGRAARLERKEADRNAAIAENGSALYLSNVPCAASGVKVWAFGHKTARTCLSHHRRMTAVI